jgi:hypothetical protein
MSLFMHCCFLRSTWLRVTDCAFGDYRLHPPIIAAFALTRSFVTLQASLTCSQSPRPFTYIPYTYLVPFLFVVVRILFQVPHLSQSAISYFSPDKTMAWRTSLAAVLAQATCEERVTDREKTTRRAQRRHMRDRKRARKKDRMKHNHTHTKSWESGCIRLARRLIKKQEATSWLLHVCSLPSRACESGTLILSGSMEVSVPCAVNMQTRSHMHTHTHT